MAESEKERLIREFNQDPANNWKPMSREERQRLAALGAESGIADEDLPFAMSGSYSEKMNEALGDNFAEESNNILKGRIVEMAQAQGITTDQLLKNAKDGLRKLMGQSPKYDA
jgi:hypothetical protein